MIGKITNFFGTAIAAFSIALVFAVLTPTALIAVGCIVVLLAIESGFDIRVKDDIGKMFGDDR